MTGTDQAIGPDGLTRRDRDIIREILARYPEVRRATLFGSRAMGTFGRGSDIDLALEGPDLTTHTLARIATDLEDSDLPYKADVLLRDPRLDPKLEEHIRRHGKPFGWEETTLGALIERDGGSIKTGPFGTHLKASEYSGAGVPLISVREVGYGSISIDDRTPRVPPNVVERMPEYVLRSGDIVFGRKGAVDRSAIVTEDQDRWFLGSDGIRLRLTETCDARFIAYMFQSPSTRSWLLQHATGTTMPSLNQAILGRVPFLCPPLAEQRAIAGVLGALDDKIELNRRTARALERLARAMFRAWFVDFEPIKAKAVGATSFASVPQPLFDALPTRLVDSEIGPVPEGWEVKPIGEVVLVKGGATPSTKNREYWDGGVHCWATPKDMSRLSHPLLLDTERRITDAGVECISSGLLPTGTVLMSSRAPVGYLAIAGIPTAINQGFIAMICDGPLPPSYVLNWAYTSMDSIHAQASGTTFPEISKKDFRPLPAVVPPEPVITAFREIAEPTFSLLTACIKENEQLATLLDYLLPCLLSGEVSVRQ